jgi:hypothetical protein
MICRPAYIVQSTDDFCFLRADGEGSVDYTHLFSAATPFDTAEAAIEAVEDHCGGRGAVSRVWVPERD